MRYDPSRVTTHRLARFRWEARHLVGYKTWITEKGRTRRGARRKLRRSLQRRAS